MRVNRWPMALLLAAVCASAHAGDSDNAGLPFPRLPVSPGADFAAHWRAQTLLGRMVRVAIPERMQSVWDTASNGWKYVPGSAVYVGASSRDIRLQSR